MTTKVTVEPAGHRIEVVQLDTGTQASAPTILAPASPAVTFYVWEGHSLEIRELPSEQANGD